MNYRKYLNSPKWKAFRLRILAERGAFCSKCRAFKRVDIHHLNYKRIGQEKPEDVVVLCRACHQGEHGTTPAPFSGPRVGFEFLEGKDCAAPRFKG